MNSLLVTGGTGFLGHFVQREIRLRGLNARYLTRKALSSDQQILGDLSRWDAGLDLASFQDAFDGVLHMAGLYDLRVAREDAFLANVIGTHTALAIAEKARIPVFVHISTVAATMNLPQQTSPVQPGQFSPDGPFPDPYAESKIHAEKLVRSWPGEFPKVRIILRPGILVGDTEEGRIQRIDGPYHAIDAFRRMIRVLRSWRGPLILPGRVEDRIPLTPVDRAAWAIVNLTQAALTQGERGLASLFIAPPRGPTARELYTSILNHLDLDLEVRLIDQQTAPKSLLKTASEVIARLPGEELEYLLGLPDLDVSATTERLGNDWCPDFADTAPQLWRGYDAFIQNR